ncbi:ABC transporter permease [bacterium LRH843]|nr:ABC transporter permease [bacterium LRH843]
MRDGMTLWQKRVRSYWNEAIRYLRLIGNSGFLFTVYVLVIIGSYYYSVLLKWLPETFPAVWVFVAVFAHFLTRGNVRTFVKPADVVFLLPYESKLGAYFQASKWYSFAFQSVGIVLVMIVLTPLFTKYLAAETGSVFLVLSLLLVVKGWNVASGWEEQRLQSEAERRTHFFLRAVINAVFVFFLFIGAGSLFIAAMFLIMGLLYFFYYRNLSRTLTLKWDHLIRVEERMLHFFYRIANAFTDVPHLRHQVHERRALSFLIAILTDSKKSVYHYLFARSFLRANDYAGIYLRLTLISAIALAVLPNGWIQLLVLLLFMHMVTNQLSTIWYHYDTTMWVDLYPVKAETKQQALTELSLRLLLIMTAVQIGVLLITSTLPIAVGALVIGSIYSYIGSHTFIHKRKR